ncbi:MAG: carbohydrate porin [Rhodoplanes sp.]|uniref:carbohydrate porin n=1 Tax=Rhodoplanes sp. TaxID=1968906 RepID=UPI0017D4950A|nr:carbohydrate porin [Rhodoplanes sp.]NVO17382.1 carbohydrate porin [Rhodoplanes sp.]
MKTRHLLDICAICALLACGPAWAAELAPRVAGAPAAGAPVAYDWTGFHLGAHLGYATGTSNWLASEPAGGASTGTVDMFNTYDMFKGTGSYTLGLQTGYTWALPSRLVLGVEADVSAPNRIGNERVFWSPTFGETGYGERVVLSGTVRGRVGYAFDSFLAYGTAGFAWSYDRLTRTPNRSAATGEEEQDGTEPIQLWRLGWAAGGGIELPLAPNWSARAEYLYTHFESSTVTFPMSGQAFTSDLSLHTVRLGLNYRIGEGGKVGDLLTTGISPLELDRFAVHGQTTFTYQAALPFRSPYAGQNSMIPSQGRQTWDATFYVGARLWDGAEFWINPEIDQGFGLSDTFGIAGFPSGEAYKVGNAYPYARIPRAFIRQTIDLGGTVEKVEGGINQFAGSQTSDRLVITAGKFSSVDVFDTNKYAHDPRTDFLNWTIADTATFDYAADAWAFTYGTAVEWYRGDWTYRAGVFDLPVTPNFTDLDPSFGQFQMIGEVERRYQLWGQPGKIAVTGFLSRARLGRFEDAIALGQATGTTPSLAAVRRYTSKPGLSVNLEQQITPDIGLFARAGFNDKNLEVNAFTDVDRTVAAGTVLSGRMWGRSDDSIGIAGIVNHISDAHVAYLNAGGLTALLGDGKLPHPGLEQILETYYSFPLGAFRATLDHQLVINPGYNRDRGPASIAAFRLRSFF